MSHSGNDNNKGAAARLPLIAAKMMTTFLILALPSGLVWGLLTDTLWLSLICCGAALVFALGALSLWVYTLVRLNTEEG